MLLLAVETGVEGGLGGAGALEKPHQPLQARGAAPAAAWSMRVLPARPSSRSSLHSPCRAFIPSSSYIPISQKGPIPICSAFCPLSNQGVFFAEQKKGVSGNLLNIPPPAALLWAGRAPAQRVSFSWVLGGVGGGWIQGKTPLCDKKSVCVCHSCGKQESEPHFGGFTHPIKGLGGSDSRRSSYPWLPLG